MRLTVLWDLALAQARLWRVSYSRLLKSLLLIIMASTLASCSQIQHYKQRFFKQKVKPEKVFQYAYKEPVRAQTAGNFARQLATAKDGTSATVKLKDNRPHHARLGRQYFSASGYECRKYTIQGASHMPVEYASCLINGRWLDTNPISNDAVFSSKNNP